MKVEDLQAKRKIRMSECGTGSKGFVWKAQFPWFFLLARVDHHEFVPVRADCMGHGSVCLQPHQVYPLGMIGDGLSGNESENACVQEQESHMSHRAAKSAEMRADQVCDQQGTQQVTTWDGKRDPGQESGEGPVIRVLPDRDKISKVKCLCLGDSDFGHIQAGEK